MSTVADWVSGPLGPSYHCILGTPKLMTRYYARHLKRLSNEASDRFQKLMRVLSTHGKIGGDTVEVDGIHIRLAVDDFKTILTEIRKLK